MKHYTGNRTHSLHEMDYDETQAIVAHLQSETGQKPKQNKPDDGMRRKILSRAHEMHWEDSEGKVDMKQLNDWCINYSGKSKPFNQYTVEELPILVTQFEKVFQSFLIGL